MGYLEDMKKAIRPPKIQSLYNISKLADDVSHRAKMAAKSLDSKKLEDLDNAKYFLLDMFLDLSDLNKLVNKFKKIK
jgi:hypothetical protein